MASDSLGSSRAAVRLAELACGHQLWRRLIQPVGVWRRRVLRARMLSAVRTTAYSAIAVGGRRSGASRSLSLEDTSPPWSADAPRRECGHYWRCPRDSEPPGHGVHLGPMGRAA